MHINEWGRMISEEKMKTNIKSNRIVYVWCFWKMSLIRNDEQEKTETRTTITRGMVYFVCLHHRNDFSVYKYCVYTIEYPNHPSMDGVTVCMCV